MTEKVLKLIDKYNLNIEKLTNEELIKDYKQDIQSLPIDYTTDGQKEVYKNLIENCKKSIDYLNEIKNNIPEEIFNSQVEMRQSYTEYFESRLQLIP